MVKTCSRPQTKGSENYSGKQNRKREPPKLQVRVRILQLLQFVEYQGISNLMPLFLNTMLINRFLREQGFIFVNNVDPRYLKALVNLGSYPIVMYIDKNTRLPKIFYQCNISHINLSHIFCHEICTVSDIKKILLILQKVLRVNTLTYISPFYIQSVLIDQYNVNK